jgi:hypothetical protein
VARTAPVGRIAWFLSALVALSACEGKTIHLGNGPDGATCGGNHVPANQVLWIGDAWVVVTGSQHTRVRDSARDASAIGPDDEYIIGAQPAASMAAIANQYVMQEAGPTKVKLLIMDGGTWDTIMANGSDASVQSVVGTFNQLLMQVASDGTVEHVIYFLMPELASIPGVAALRPLLKAACEQRSTVPCHFLDLQPVWANHPEYTVTVQGIPAPTEAGSQAIADAIWAIMQQYCIAQ